MDFIPSYDRYRKILSDIAASGKYCDYADAIGADEFLILRHDIEFSVERAYEMSLIESEMGICSTYFLQITNAAYNAFSLPVKNMILDMHQRGHKIGLHYHLGGVTDPLRVRDGIRDQIRILSELYGIPIDRFSMHRPAREARFHDIPIDGVINAYAPEFFTLADSIDENTPLEVKYIADSRHRWNYGVPDRETIEGNRKIQLLIHPDFWTASGHDAAGNFSQLIREHTHQFIATIDSECNHFAPSRSLFDERAELL